TQEWQHRECPESSSGPQSRPSDGPSAISIVTTDIYRNHFARVHSEAVRGPLGSSLPGPRAASLAEAESSEDTVEHHVGDIHAEHGYRVRECVPQVDERRLKRPVGQRSFACGECAGKRVEQLELAERRDDTALVRTRAGAKLDFFGQALE